ncbi:MAG: glycosyltransferase family 2 protein [Deltaproteobacteria bacterium]|nr:glycosyltransferase family 2 protein [Deltaproteobacteria bacterium]
MAEKSSTESLQAKPGARPTLAFTLIGHNEAHTLPRCLDSILWADQIVYVDCESSDGSAEVARLYTPHVFNRPNNSNLNINKTHGIDQARTDWVFYLDPDEEIDAALAEEIQRVIASNPPQNAFRLPRRNFFFGHWVRRGGQYPDTQLRLFRRGKARFPCVHVHEKLEVDGEVGDLRHAMNHYTNPTPLDALKKVDFYSTFNANVMVKEGRRPSPVLAWRLLFWLPTSRLLRRYLLKGGFRDGYPGLIVALLDSLELQMRFIKFWHLAGRQAAAQGKPGLAQDKKEHS